MKYFSVNASKFYLILIQLISFYSSSSSYHTPSEQYHSSASPYTTQRYHIVVRILLLTSCHAFKHANKSRQNLSYITELYSLYIQCTLSPFYFMV